MNRRTFLTLAGLVWSGGLQAADRRAEARRSTDLDLGREVTKVPAIVVAGVVVGKPVQLASGIAADTSFPAASLTKPVFALAVRDLVKDGKLDWDKPLQDYAPLGLTGEAQRITAAHVLTHSSGLPNWRFQAGQALAAEFPPGTRWQYSGEGMVLLQRVVETIAGAPIAKFMKDRVLTPLGMSASTLAWNPDLRAAVGHDRNAQPLERALTFYERKNFEILEKAGLRGESATYDQIVAAYEAAKAPAIPIAMSPNMAGSLQTTAADYAKFLAHIAADVAARPADFRPRIDVNRRIAWTLGWGVDRSFAAPAYFHWGDGPGFKNFAWVRRERKTHLVLLTNGDRGAALYAWVFRQLTGEDPAAFYWT